jgi:hypothetical protein
MPSESTTVFLWDETLQERRIVAASACSDSVEVYYAVENSGCRRGSCCTVSSHIWFADTRRYHIEQFLELD